MTLFNSTPSGGPTRLAPLDAAFVRAHSILFSGKPRDQLDEAIETFIGLLGPFIKKSPKQWLEKGLVSIEKVSGLIILTHAGTTLGFH